MSIGEPDLCGTNIALGIVLHIPWCLLAHNCFSYWLCIFGLPSLLYCHRKFFVDKYGLSYSNANFVSSLVYFISVVACPIVGFLVDKTGFNLIWCKYLFLCITTAFSVLSHTKSCDRFLNSLSSWPIKTVIPVTILECNWDSLYVCELVFKPHSPWCGVLLLNRVLLALFVARLENRL